MAHKIAFRAKIKQLYGEELIKDEVLAPTREETPEQYENRINKYLEDHTSGAYRAAMALIGAADSIGNAVSNAISDNFCECILDKMPGVNNDIAAKSVGRECRNKSGKTCESKSNDWFGVKKREECLSKYAKDTSSEYAAKAIQQACWSLYKD